MLGERGGKRAGIVQASDDGPGEEFSIAKGVSDAWGGDGVHHPRR